MAGPWLGPEERLQERVDAATADLSADYQLNEHVALTGYYALASGRTVIEKIYPKGSTGQLAYAELNWKF